MGKLKNWLTAALIGTAATGVAVHEVRDHKEAVIRAEQRAIRDADLALERLHSAIDAVRAPVSLGVKSNFTMRAYTIVDIYISRLPEKLSNIEKEQALKVYVAAVKLQTTAALSLPADSSAVISSWRMRFDPGWRELLERFQLALRARDISVN